MADIEQILSELKKTGGKLIGYARVSSDDQNCAVQIAQLKKMGCQKIYADKKSGRSRDRIEFQKCLDYLREGDVLAFTRVDRLGRSLRDLVNIAFELKEKNISLYIIQQNIDTSSPMGQMFYSMLGIMAEFEFHLKRERQIEGIAKAKLEGKYKGRNPLSDQLITQIQLLRENSVSPTKIAQQLNIGRTSVYKYLKDINVALPSVTKGDQ